MTTTTTTSLLYGANGEKWLPNGRLLDYSYAGNVFSIDTSVPNKERYNIKQFGAKGDGVSDDTSAFKKAFAESEFYLYIPTGTYVITDTIERKTPLYILGDGIDKTVVYFPKSARQLFGKAGDPPNTFSFDPCFFQLGQQYTEQTLGNVTLPAKRGDTRVYGDFTKSVTVGQWIRIMLKDTPNGDLYRLVYDNDATLLPEEGFNKDTLKIPNRITLVGKDFVEFERPLPIDINLVCPAHIQTFYSITNSFIVSGLSFKAPFTKYKGHLVEDGFNTLLLVGCCNSRVQDVSFDNIDIGIKLTFSHFNLLKNIHFRSENKRSGHHGIWLLSGGDNLVQDFKFDLKFIHDISVEKLTSMNVFHNGSGIDLNLDHHRFGPYANLFTNIDLGDGTRAFSSSGKPRRGTHAGSLNTFWNLTRGGATIPLPSSDKNAGKPRRWGPSVNAIGNFGVSKDAPSDWFVERITSGLSPPNLYESMLQTRRERL